MLMHIVASIQALESSICFVFLPQPKPESAGVRPINGGNLTLRPFEMQAQELADRLGNILEALTWDIFSYVCLGLFEQHKLMFAFQITCKIMQQKGQLNPEEIDFFIKGKLSLDASPQAKPASWIPEQVNPSLAMVQAGSSAKRYMKICTGKLCW